MNINMTQLQAFSDELSKIAHAKVANLSAPVAPHVPPSQGPPPVVQPNQSTPRGMSPLEPKKPTKGGLSSGKVPSYTKTHAVPTPGRSEGYQPVSASPAVKS